MLKRFKFSRSGNATGTATRHVLAVMPPRIGQPAFGAVSAHARSPVRIGQPCHLRLGQSQAQRAGRQAEVGQALALSTDLLNRALQGRAAPPAPKGAEHQERPQPRKRGPLSGKIKRPGL